MGGEVARRMVRSRFESRGEAAVIGGSATIALR